MLILWGSIFHTLILYGWFYFLTLYLYSNRHWARDPAVGCNLPDGCCSCHGSYGQKLIAARGPKQPSQLRTIASRESSFYFAELARDAKYSFKLACAMRAGLAPNLAVQPVRCRRELELIVRGAPVLIFLHHHVGLKLICYL